MLDATACERGDDPNVPLPELRTITVDELAEEWAAPDTAQNSESHAGDAVLAALHLIPKGQSANEASLATQIYGTAAFYEPDLKRMTLVDRSTLSRDDGMFILSHELTHYLQDLDVDLVEFEAARPGDFDGVVATRSLIEGEAWITSMRVLARVYGRLPRELEWNGLLDVYERELMTSIDESPAPLFAATYGLPYLVGGRYVASAWHGNALGPERWIGTRERVDRLFGDAPLSLVDWLAGYHAIATSRVESLDCGLPSAPPGWDVSASVHFGPTVAIALLGAAKAADLALAAELRGDAVAMYAPQRSSDTDPQQPITRALIAWRMRFASERARETFEARIGVLGLTLRGDGQELVITASGDGDNPLTGAALEECTPIAEPETSMAELPPG